MGITLVSGRLRKIRLLGLLMLFSILAAPACRRNEPKPAAAAAAVSDRFAVNQLPKASTSKLIVLIHGVFGDAASTWDNPGGTSWQKLLSSPRFTEFSVYVVDYPTPKLDRASGIEEIANGVLLHLQDDGVFERYSEIVLVGHSMGGLIAKRILIDLNRPTQINKLRRVKAVFYISTPAQGAPLGELGSWLSRNPQLKDMSPADLNSFLQIVENMWQNLMRDRATAGAPRAYCAYETEQTGPTMVVSRVYAATLCDENPLPVAANHMSIVKPRDDQDPVFAWFSARALASSGRHSEPANDATAATAPARVQTVPELISRYKSSIAIVRSGDSFSGTGFIVGKPNLLLTMNFIVQDSGSSINVTFADDGRPYEAHVVASDANSKLAILKVEAPANRAALPVAFSPTLPVASRLVVLGFDLARDATTLTAWNVTFTAATNDGQWRTSAEGSVPGRAGSPVIDDRGTVIGAQVGTDVTAGSPPAGLVVPLSAMSPLIRGVIGVE